MAIWPNSPYAYLRNHEGYGATSNRNFYLLTEYIKKHFRSTTGENFSAMSPGSFECSRKCLLNESIKDPEINVLNNIKHAFKKILYIELLTHELINFPPTSNEIIFKI